MVMRFLPKKFKLNHFQSFLHCWHGSHMYSFIVCEKNHPVSLYRALFQMVSRKISTCYYLQSIMIVFWVVSQPVWDWTNKKNSFLFGGNKKMMCSLRMLGFICTRINSRINSMTRDMYSINRFPLYSPPPHSHGNPGLIPANFHLYVCRNEVYYLRSIPLHQSTYLLLT